MANEIQYRSDLTGMTCYATIRNAAGQYYNGATFETLAVANWTTYALALTETPAGSYRYIATFPPIVAGTYGIDLYEQAGASPAITDVLAAATGFDWDGTVELTGLRLRRVPDAAPGGAGGLALADGLRIESA